MTVFRTYIGLAAIILSSLIWTIAAQEDVVLVDRDDDPPEPLVYKAKTGAASKFGEMPLDGRSLIASWLGKRQSCVSSGYSPCTSMFDLSWRLSI
jgi:hypothetical protein